MKGRWIGGLVVGMVLLMHQALWGGGQPPEGKTVLNGVVVDAACYMIHPQGATPPGHSHCAVECAKRGVPLAILNDSDGKLYFPADGNKRVGKLVGKRVQVTGTVKQVADPMQLSMPVGTANTLSVRVDGGYAVVEIANLTPASQAPRMPKR